MSPEQMRSSKNVDQRSDIWGLGVILYELLTGRVPFEAEAIPELCLKVVQDPAEAPKSIRAEVPEGLSAIVLKCLEKDPNNRFSNVAELAVALEPYSEVARGASERIASTLNVPSRPPMVSISSLASGSNPKVGTGGTAWGTTQALEAKKKKPPFVIIGAAAAGVVGVIAIGVALKSSSAKPDTQVAAQPSATVSATSTAAPTQTAAQSSAEPTATQSVVTAPATTTAATAPRGTAKPGVSAKAQTTGTKTAAAAVTAPPKNFE
jgi:serine/threonine-protein kinase